VKLATDCLNAGTHVIVEKPIAFSRAEFLQLWELAQSKNRILIEDHNYRYNEPILAMQEIVKSGRIGEVREVEVRMNLAVRGKESRYMDRSLPNPAHKYPCGVIHEFITHLCYLGLLFTPPKIDTIKCAWRKHGTDDIFKYDDLDALLIAGPVHTRIRYASDTGPDCFIVAVHGDKGTVSTDLFLPHVRLVAPRKGGKQLTPLVNHWCNGWELVRSSVRNFRNKIMQKTPYEGLQRFLGIAYAGMVNHTPLPITFDDMDRTITLIDSLLDEANRV
jgi:predicted dehydrogenase